MSNMPSDIIELVLPVPPGFEQVMGYPGNRKWVAFFWSPFGDELEFDDGHSSGTIDWPGWLAFIQHRLVRPLIQGYDFGSSESEARHWLLLDRQARQFYAGPKTVVSNFLQSFTRQFAFEPVELSHEQLEQFAQQLPEQRAAIPPEDIRRMLSDKKRRVDELVLWLDHTYDEIVTERKG